MNSAGEYSMEFNSKGMFRGVCDSTGECSVGIWEEMMPFKVESESEFRTQDPAYVDSMDSSNIAVNSLEVDERNQVRMQ